MNAMQWLNSPLTLGLAALGLFLLLALGLHGWWQVRRARPLTVDVPVSPAERQSKAKASEGDTWDARVEPVMGDAWKDWSAVGSALDRSSLGHDELGSGTWAADAALAEGGSQGITALHPVAAIAATVAAARAPSHPIDALIDAVVPMRSEAEVSGDAVLVAMPPSMVAGSKPFAIEVWNAQSQAWELPVPGGRYRDLQAGLQLANRHARQGHLTEIEFSEFVQKIQRFADDLGVTPDFPDMLTEVERARDLDGVAARFDVQLSARLVPAKAAWSLAFVVQQVRALGMVPGHLPGRLVLPGPSDGDPPRLVLYFDPNVALSEDSSMAIVPDLSLVFDVPQIDRQVHGFDLWVQTLEQLAKVLQAQLLDDLGQNLSLDSLRSVGTQLEPLYDEMEQWGLPAGTPSACRLFSA